MYSRGSCNIRYKVISVNDETKTGILCTSMEAILTDGYRPIRERAEKSNLDDDK